MVLHAPCIHPEQMSKTINIYEIQWLSVPPIILHIPVNPKLGEVKEGDVEDVKI